MAISEPKVGAHPKLLTTRAEPVEGGFRISGQKAWVTNGPSADAIIVFAITAEDDGRKRYSAFIVPRETPGVTTADMPGFHALRPSRHCLLTLDGCFVPKSAMLGPSGSAYERMALPFRDIEDAVGTFGTLGALRHALSQFAGIAFEQTEDLGAIVALVAVFAAGAEAVVGSLDDGQPPHTQRRAGRVARAGGGYSRPPQVIGRTSAHCEHPRRPRSHPVDRARPSPGAADPTRGGRDPRPAQPMTTRCHWAETTDALMQAYHDTEWGVPHHDDAALFELLTLEGAQAGLSWRTVLVRRDAYRKAYHGFEIERVAAMSDADLEALLADSPLIRNRLKIFSTRDNARAALNGDCPTRQPGPLSLVVRQPNPDPQQVDRALPGPGHNTRFGRNEQGAEESRVPFRRLHHMLCVHAGHRHGGRPHGGLLPAHPRVIHARCDHGRLRILAGRGENLSAFPGNQTYPAPLPSGGGFRPRGPLG